METQALLLAATLQAGTVLALAALGLLINEKSGVVNLGAEGMMLCAALAGFATVVHTGSDMLGFLAGMGSGALLAAVFGVLVIGLGTNAYATGLALSLFGAGLSAFAGLSYVKEQLPDRVAYAVPYLSDLPWLGTALFKHHPLVYLAIALGLGLMLWLDRSRSGLILRAVGESPESAHALGYRVRLIRMAAVMAGARHVQGTLNGLGERCGNADMIAVLPSLVLKTGYVRETDGRYYVTSRLDTFLSVERGGVELLTKTLHPLVGNIADNNFLDRKSTRLNSSHMSESRMPSSA